MKIYESAVRKPVSTVLMFVGVMVFGLFSLMNLAVDQYPEIEIPQISVITFYPGANAADIETNITRILEDNLNTVSNLKKLTLQVAGQRVDDHCRIRVRIRPDRGRQRDP